MNHISKDKIKELNSLPIEDVAEALGLEVQRHRVLCFMHDDHNPSLYFNRRTNWWRCFACEKGGNVISLVMGYQKSDFLSACNWLAEQFNMDLEYDTSRRPSTRPKTNKTSQSPNNIAKSPKKKNTIDYELYNWVFQVAGLSPKAQQFLYDERHYSKEAVKELKIASITDPQKFAQALVKKFGEPRALKSKLVRRIHSDNFPNINNQLICTFITPCLIFPYCDASGRIISVQSRYLGKRDDLPRFQFIKGSTVSIFNRPVLNTLTDDEILYIAEGVTDCLALMSMGHKAIAIPSATLLKAKDASLLAHCNLMMYPDADSAGEHLYDKLCSLLVPYNTPVSHLSLPDGCKDISEWYVRKKRRTTRF